ncbi:unnamed protein product [Nippostrongylus brasiliensis]|uniref:Reverse transcriptase n=1 Tax=Nippostrongylus brasiliensis TaxID=27835 RepID=A0A0N4YJE0_NIPBR|nr:unnamed protein product [Nippostrongylus brasiliensis]
MVNTPRSSLAPVNAAFECLNSTPKSGLLDAYTKAQESLHNEIIEVDEVVNEEPNGKEQTDTLPPEEGDLLPLKTARSEYKAVAVEVLQSSPDDKSEHVRLKIKRVCT